jgi:hypothetical protein
MRVLFIYAFLVSCVPVFAGEVCDFPGRGTYISEAAASGISKAEFERVMDQVDAVYKPIFSKWGCQFRLIRSWSDSEANAQAWREGNVCYVEMFGGLARYPGMTAAGMMLVAMHEIGHHMGGSPYYTGSSMSVEGQADYFATLYGMPQMQKPSRAASFVLASTLARLAGEPKPWRPGPYLKPVSKTLQSHPPAQCRLRTYDSGRLRAGRPSCWLAGGV